MNLILIRHGQSEANQNGLLISSDKDSLTALGVSQSVCLAEAIVHNKLLPDVLYSSPWRRALQTTEIVFPEHRQSVKLDSRLAETNPGVYGTWKEADFNQQFPDFYNNLANRYEGGESHLDMAARVCDWVDTEIISRQDESGLCVAVAHGGPISVILQYLLGMQIEERYPSFTVPNASYTYLQWRSDLKRYCAIFVGKN